MDRETSFTDFAAWLSSKIDSGDPHRDAYQCALRGIEAIRKFNPPGEEPDAFFAGFHYYAWASRTGGRNAKHNAE